MEMITGIVKHKKVIKRGMSVIGLTSGETLLLTLLKELFKCQSEDWSFLICQYWSDHKEKKKVLMKSNDELAGIVNILKDWHFGSKCTRKGMVEFNYRKYKIL